MFTHRLKQTVLVVLSVASMGANQSAEANLEDESTGTRLLGVEDSLRVYQIDEILVERTRADRPSSPVAYTDLTREEIRKVSYGQDVPMVLMTMPSTYAYSDAANGFGYSYLKIRGFDQNRLGILVNGVPLNDPESHQVYWVDHADVLSGASSVQVQRGIGTTLFGATSFGGSVNVLTSPLAVTRGLHLETGYGDYTDHGLDLPLRTYRASVASGPIHGGSIAIYGRYSHQESAGYREASGAEMDSYAFSGLYGGKFGNHKFDVLVGKEISHFAWDGISPDFGFDLNDRRDRRFNYYALNGNNIDDFRQVITSLTSEFRITDRITLTNTAYYVNGDGFFEQYKENRDLYDYGYAFMDSIYSDLTQKRWLKNHYWGLIPQVSAPIADGKLMVGAAVRRYASDHFGEILWTEIDLPFDPGDQYYSYEATKTSFETYGQLQLPIRERTILSAGLQYQGHRYDWNQARMGNYRGYEFSVDHDFVSPRVGLKYTASPGLSVYGSASFAQREPSDSDYIDGDDPWSVPAFERADEVTVGLDEPIIDPEKVLDLELGLTVEKPSWKSHLGVYRLDFRDELIPIDGGRIEEEGRLKRANAKQTVHTGIEIEATALPIKGVTINGNLSLAQHRFVDHEIFAYWLNDYEGGLLQYEGNTIPRSPEVLGNAAVTLEDGPFLFRGDLQYVGKQFIDGENTEDLAIGSWTLVHLSTEIELGGFAGLSSSLRIRGRINNLFNRLYETWGYSYYDDFPPRSFSFYWPGATRSYFLGLSLAL